MHHTHLNTQCPQSRQPRPMSSARDRTRQRMTRPFSGYSTQIPISRSWVPSSPCAEAQLSLQPRRSLDTTDAPSQTAYLGARHDTDQALGRDFLYLSRSFHSRLSDHILRVASHLKHLGLDLFVLWCKHRTPRCPGSLVRRSACRRQLFIITCTVIPSWRSWPEDGLVSRPVSVILLTFEAFQVVSGACDCDGFVQAVQRVAHSDAQRSEHLQAILFRIRPWSWTFEKRA